MNLEAAPPARFNFAAHLLAVNAGRHEHIAYVDDAGRLSYGALDTGVRRFAAALLALGMRREDRLLLLMHDCTHWPIAFLGALYAGVVPVAVNTLLSAGEYAYMLAHGRARLAVVSQTLLPTLQQAINAGPVELHTVVVSRASATAGQDTAGQDAAGRDTAGSRTTGPQSHDFDLLLGEHRPADTAADTSADEPAFWLYSSGSTGQPKGTVHTHANPYWTARLYGQAVLQLREDDVCFSAAKLFFAYGLGNALSFPLSVGATVVLMAERPTPDAVFKRWRDHQPTIFFGAPTGYAGMLASPRLPARSELNLRLCSSAGEALPKELGERFSAHFGVPIVDGIGSTEMLHIFISNTPHDVRYGTSGKPVPGYSVQLRDDAGATIEASDQVGDLYVQGPSAALLYWAQRAKSLETFQGPWTRSGDKYVRSADGYFTYAGRSDDMLKVSGQYVSPFEVEATLIEHEAVLEAALIGVIDADGLTRSKAFVVLKDPGRASDAMASELQQFVKTRLAPHKYPRQLAFLAELPKTATGKIQRFRLRETESASSTSS